MMPSSINQRFNNLKTFHSFILCLCLIGSVQASNFLHFSVGDGLPFVQVSGITQSPSGSLWLGGYGGIANYNGIEFKHYQFRENIPHSNVTAVLSVQNTLFVGTTKGLYAYRDGNFDVVATVQPFKVNEVLELGRLNDRVFVLYKDKVSFLNKNADSVDFSVSTNGAFDILSCGVQNDNTLLLGTTAGLYRVNNDTIEFIKGTGKLKVVSINTEMGIVLGTARGVYALKGNEVIAVKNFNRNIVGRVIFELLYFDSATTFIVTEFGLNRCKSGDCDYLSVGDQDRSNQVNTLFTDREGNLWAGTNFGLYKYTANAFKKYGKNTGLTEAFIYGIDSDDDGVWVAAGRSGIVKYAQKSFTGYGSSHGMLKGIYRDVLCTGDSVIATCDQGVSVRTGNRLKNFTFAGNDEITGVNACFQNESGQIVLCTKGGAGIFKNGKYESLFFIPDAEFETWAGVQDNAGRYWFGTYEGGLWIVENGDARRVDQELGINGKQFLALDRDYKGNIWIGTFNGVYIYKNNGEIVHFDEQDGLNSGLIYSFVQDGDSNIWVGTNQGINRFKLPDYYAGSYPNILSFGKKDGFTGVECNVNGAYHDGENLWFGTVDGLMKFDPAGYIRNNIPPVLSITGTKLFYADTLLQSGVVLPYNQNHITFNFLGVSLSNPEQVKYSFKLEGFDQKWSPPDYLNPATYSGLSPGRYTFRLKSANSRGVWNEHPVEFSFQIKEHFTQTAWFQLSSGAFVLGIIGWIYYMQVRRYKVKRDLERKLDSLKLKALRSQMNPHFIFNSMNSIQYFINHNEKLEANRYLSKFASLMRKMLNNSREELIPLGDDLAALDLYLQLEKMRFEDKFDYELIYEKEEIKELMIPSMVIQPFVENAIIHGFKKIDYRGKLRVEFSMSRDYLVCIIDDNGRGVKNTLTSKALTSHKSASTGITEERLQTLTKLHKQQRELFITDKSDENSELTGTRVEIRFPYV